MKMRRSMIDEHREQLGIYEYDGASDLMMIKSLDDEISFESTRKTDNANIRIDVKFQSIITLKMPEMFRFLNIQFRNNLKSLGYKLIGRNFFDPDSRTLLNTHKLEIWRGIMTAINEYDGGPLLMTETRHRVVRVETVYDILRKIYARDAETFQENARRELVGNIVLTKYIHRTYKIEDIDFEQNPLNHFQRREGDTISYKDYYKEQYNITIKDERQPLIICATNARQSRAGLSSKVYLVPELCFLTGLTDSLKSDQRLRVDLIAATRLAPTQRVENHLQFCEKLRTNVDIVTKMTDWNVNVDDHLVHVPARVLNGEEIVLSNDFKFTFDGGDADFLKFIRDKKMKTPVSISKWAIIMSSKDTALNHIVDQFAATLRYVCEPFGVHIGRPDVRMINDERTASFASICSRVPDGYQIVVAILPNSNSQRYNTIKQIFYCTNRPFVSQVILANTLKKSHMLQSICTKVGIQMACKLGAEPWVLNIPPQNLMVIGYDLHLAMTPGVDQFVTGFVCSLNQTLTKYYSHASFHANDEQISINFVRSIEEGLRKYFEFNKRLPNQIVIYRDGVSEGQLQHVYDYEVKRIEARVREINPKIQITFIIVKKRISTKFYLQVGSHQFNNPARGTIVDNTVTCKDQYDFYLVSQSVRQGTVAPTKYNVIFDTTHWTANHQQLLAYKLTHLYYNWPGTIRVPAPCQYAHKLAYLTATSLHRGFNHSLSTSLFYL
ncbi:piwi-like protein 1 [Dinothrombium tinctorium]|nr:piwi-like protein 1 [Dinothrombium tinctorium]